MVDCGGGEEGAEWRLGGLGMRLSLCLGRQRTYQLYIRADGLGFS